MGPKPVTEKSTPKRGADAGGKVFEEFAHETVVMIGLGSSSVGRFLLRNPILSTLLVIGLHFICTKLIELGFHIGFVSSLSPEILTPQRVSKWISRVSVPTQEWTLFSILCFPILFISGFLLRMRRTKYEKIFRNISLTNGLGQTPVMVAERKLDSFRKEYVFDSKGLSKSDFETLKERIESSFGMPIECIESEKNPRFVRIIFTTDTLPVLFPLNDALKQVSLGDGEFVIGKSSKGIVKQAIMDLPHLLIAGTTGRGKSVFFKSTLICLLRSRFSQLYLIDLKRGLEAADFRNAPNVAIVKNMQDAVTLLSKIKKVMEARFDYLEREGRKEIIPGKDKMDRIVVAVDESSVLHQKRDRSDPEYSLAQEARHLIDNLSKLSRAAAINIILATQKIDKETIPTTVQENVTGRMAFKANTIQGSVVVLGGKEAFDLPDIRGRGLWKAGADMVMVQAPMVTEQDVLATVKEVSEEFNTGQRKLQQPMISFCAEKITGKQIQRDEMINKEGKNEKTA